jgi:hypothetical protein
MAATDPPCRPAWASSVRANSKRIVRKWAMGLCCGNGENPCAELVPARNRIQSDAFGRRRRRHGPLALKCIECPARVKPWGSGNEDNHLLKFGGVKLRRDVIHAPFVQQQDSGNYILANALRQPNVRPLDAARH